MIDTAKQIHKELLGAENILLVSHKNPDGDALSSGCALMQYLRQLNKNHIAYCATPISKNLNFLPHAEYYITNPQILTNNQFDLIIVLDSGDLLYAGLDEFLKKLDYAPIVVNIDHHATNEFYGHHNLVFSNAASTTEVLYSFFKINKIAIDKYIATCLLTGIIADTAYFSNPATTAQSLKIAAELLRLGGNLNLIQGWTVKNRTVRGLKIWGQVLSRLYKNEKYDIISTILTADDLIGTEAAGAAEEVEGIANFLNNLGEGRIVLLLKDKGDGIIKASMRTTNPKIDLSALAKMFGGGGHAKAAGFSVKGKLIETENGWKII
jgi:phosphoesterase RecJ-like protein